MYNGSVIRDARLAQHLTQAELAVGICDQETISHIETNSTNPTDRIIRAVINRLNLHYEDIMANKPVNANYALSKIEDLVKAQQYQSAIKRINSLDRSTLTTHTMIETDFLIAFVNLQLNKDYNQAIFEFNRVITGENKPLTNLFAILSIEQLGLVYYFEKDIPSALVYFDQVPDLLEKAKITSNLYWVAFIYNDLAYFYSQTNKYSLSNHFAKLGLKLLRDHHQVRFADMLNYTIGKNYATKTVNWEKSLATHYLMQAITFARFNNNYNIVKQAQEIIDQHTSSSVNK